MRLLGHAGGDEDFVAPEALRARPFSLIVLVDAGEGAAVARAVVSLVVSDGGLDGADTNHLLGISVAGFDLISSWLNRVGSAPLTAPPRNGRES